MMAETANERVPVRLGTVSLEGRKYKVTAKATFWAWEQDATGTNKLVLLALADVANDDGRCWPSKHTVAQKCGVSPKTVQRSLGELEELGLIERDERFRGDGSQTSSHYRLRTPPRSNWPPTPGQNDPAILEPTQKEPTQKNTSSAQASFLPDPVNETWDVYVEVLDRPRAVLTPKVRKWITDAHKAVGVDMTRQAIRGLGASDWHREKGHVGIENAIRPKQNETVEGRIAFMAAKAPAEAATVTNGPMTVEQFANRYQPEVRDRLLRGFAAINAMAGKSHDDVEYHQGRAALGGLTAHGFEPIMENDVVVGVRPV